MSGGAHDAPPADLPPSSSSDAPGSGADRPATGHPEAPAREDTPDQPDRISWLRTPGAYARIQRVIDEWAWYRELQGHDEHVPRAAPEVTDCAQDIKHYLLRFWPKTPRDTGRARQHLGKNTAFWNRIALHRLRFQGGRNWYLVAHSYDQSRRILTLKIPAAEAPAYDERLRHAARQATFNDDPRGRYGPGIKVKDSLMDYLTEDEVHLREGLTTGFPILRSGALPLFHGDNYTSCIELKERAGADLERQHEVGCLEGPLHYVPANVCSLGSIYQPVPKDKFRNVWDLTASGMNGVTIVPQTRYDLLSDILPKQRPGCWMSGFDWKDSFWNWARAQPDCDYIGVRHPVTGDYYRARYAVFGASDSPYIQAEMSQVIKRVINTHGLRHVPASLPRARDYSTFEATGIFVDDGHMVHDASLTKAEADAQTRSVIQVFNDLGIGVSDKKTQWPAKVKDYVGVDIDSVRQTVSIRKERRARYIEAIDDLMRDIDGPEGPSHLNRIKLASLVGKLQFCAELVPGGQAKLTHCYRARDNFSRTDYAHRTIRGQWRKDVTVDSSRHLRGELLEWRRILRKGSSRRYYLHPRPRESGFWKGVVDDSDDYMDEHWATSTGIPAFRIDAAGDAGGAAFQNHRHIHQFPRHQCRPERGSDIGESSNFRELYMFLVALRLWGSKWKGRPVLGRCDNTTAVSIINRQGTHAPRLRKLAKRILNLAAKHDIEIAATHIRGEINVLADRLSRHVRRYDPADWMYDPDLYNAIVALVGDHTVDAQSDPVGHNSQCPRFWSTVESCFEQRFAKERIWANPDFSLLESFLDKFRAEFAQSPYDTSLTLLVPVWFQRKFWRKLKGAKLLAFHPAGSKIFTSPHWERIRRGDNRFSMANHRVCRGPTEWDCAVVHFPSAVDPRCGPDAAQDPGQDPTHASPRRELHALPTLSGRPEHDVHLLPLMQTAPVPGVQPV